MLCFTPWQHRITSCLMPWQHCITPCTCLTVSHHVSPGKASARTRVWLYPLSPGKASAGPGHGTFTLCLRERHRLGPGHGITLCRRERHRLGPRHGFTLCRRARHRLGPGAWHYPLSPGKASARTGAWLYPLSPGKASARTGAWHYPLSPGKASGSDRGHDFYPRSPGKASARTGAWHYPLSPGKASARTGAWLYPLSPSDITAKLQHHTMILTLKSSLAGIYRLSSCHPIALPSPVGSFSVIQPKSPDVPRHPTIFFAGLAVPSSFAVYMWLRGFITHGCPPYCPHNHTHYNNTIQQNLTRVNPKNYLWLVHWCLKCLAHFFEPIFTHKTPLGLVALCYQWFAEIVFP